jgi:hypothetical protein
MLVGNTNEPNNRPERIMDIRRIDIGDDYFFEKMGSEEASALRDGQDVTAVFADDISAPVKAVIIEVKGPGGIPCVEFSFDDTAHYHEWVSSNLGFNPEDEI